MGISPDLPIERIVESMFRDFSVGVEERLLDLPQNVAETNKKRLMNPEDMKYDDYLKSWGAYMGQIGEITSIAKTFAESSLELDIMPQKKFIEVKRDLTKKVIDYYTECSLTKLITEEKFESKQGRTNAFKLYQLQKNIEMQGLIHIMGDVKNNLIRKLKKGNITDYLTGLYNKRYFDARLLEEVERVKRNGKGHTVSLVLLDIDDFSKFNTKYGHPIADKVLKYAGEFLSQYANKRKTDIVARYGGEEFAFILPNTSDREAANITKEKIKSTVNYAIRKLRDERINIEDLAFSAGICSLGEDTDANSLINHADDALYYVKNNGKNGIETYQKSKIEEYKIARNNYKKRG